MENVIETTKSPLDTLCLRRNSYMGTGFVAYEIYDWFWNRGIMTYDTENDSRPFEQAMAGLALLRKKTTEA